VSLTKTRRALDKFRRNPNCKSKYVLLPTGYSVYHTYYPAPCPPYISWTSEEAYTNLSAADPKTILITKAWLDLAISTMYVTTLGLALHHHAFYILPPQGV
jgi:hypothetical protein